VEKQKDLEWLRQIVRRLLGPGGCPWDREQTPATLKPFLLEEAHEVVDAIDQGEPAHLCEELGDLLFQIVLQAELARLPMEQVIAGIGEKLIRRHPHVFAGEGQPAIDTDQVRRNWEKIKQQEHQAHGEHGAVALLQGVPRSMPALRRAQLLGTRAAKVGFDWPDAASVTQKVKEELGELEEAVAGGDPARMDHELGDLLLAVVNWARKLGLDAEDQLQAASRRFVTRFAHVEAELQRRGTRPEQSSLEEMEQLWREAKLRE
jgi:MazG family protein